MTAQATTRDSSPGRRRAFGGIDSTVLGYEYLKNMHSVPEETHIIATA